MAELHVIGQVVGAAGFACGEGLFCKWSFHAGPAWDVIEGHTQGQTHVDRPAAAAALLSSSSSSSSSSPLAAANAPVVWSHPFDVHYHCRALSGWSRLQVQVWREDGRGRVEICAYGFVHVPMAPGNHEVDVLTWAPEGTALDRLRAFLWGGAPRLSDERAVACASGDRHGLRTATRGIVRLRLSVIAKDFARHNVSI